jgi:hypothetical protein
MISPVSALCEKSVPIPINLSAEPAVGIHAPQRPVDGVVCVDKMPRAMGSCAADFQLRRARMADRRHAPALMKELAEFQRAGALRRMREDANQVIRHFPKGLVLAADRIAQALELMGSAFVRVEVGTLDVNAEKVRAQLAGAALLREQLQRGGHLLVGLGHDRREHRRDAVARMNSRATLLPAASAPTKSWLKPPWLWMSTRPGAMIIPSQSSTRAFAGAAGVS